MDRQLSPLLSVRLSVDYPNKPGVLEDLSFTVDRGEIVGLIGRSGSGKSTVALSILRLLHLSGGTVRGSIKFAGRDLMQCTERELRRIRGKEIGLVLQSPMSALNPALRIATQIREAWRAHSSEAFSACPLQPLFETLGLPTDPAFLRRYPKQLSVGQAQRVVIAMAVLHRPQLVIADEPTSALDPRSRDDTLELFQTLNVRMGVAILYISHDLESVGRLCRRVISLDGTKGHPRPAPEPTLAVSVYVS